MPNEYSQQGIFTIWMVTLIVLYIKVIYATVLQIRLKYLYWPLCCYWPIKISHFNCYCHGEFTLQLLLPRWYHTLTLIAMVISHFNSYCHGDITLLLLLPWWYHTSTLIAKVISHFNSYCHGDITLQLLLPWWYHTSTLIAMVTILINVKRHSWCMNWKEHNVLL